MEYQERKGSALEKVGR